VFELKNRIRIERETDETFNCTKIVRSIYYCSNYLGVTTLVTNWKIGRVNNAYQEILDNEVHKLVEINNMKALMQDETNHVRGYLLTGEVKYLVNYKKSTIEMKALVKEVLSKEKTAKGKQLVNDISDAEIAYQQAANRSCIINNRAAKKSI